jgi:hypothetical protein
MTTAPCRHAELRLGDAVVTLANADSDYMGHGASSILDPKGRE